MQTWMVLEKDLRRRFKAHPGEGPGLNEWQRSHYYSGKPAILFQFVLNAVQSDTPICSRYGISLRVVNSIPSGGSVLSLRSFASSGISEPPNSESCERNILSAKPASTSSLMHSARFSNGGLKSVLI